MPSGDRTGPEGLGPMTGRGAGRGWRNRYYATALPGWVRDESGIGYRSSQTVSETRVLEEKREFFRQELKEVEQKLKELGEESGSGKE